MNMRLVSWLAVTGLVISPAMGQLDVGSDGSDGALDCAALFALNPACLSDCSAACTVEIDLGLAATATWDTPSPVAGQGVYDGAEWAVVFKYTAIDIPAGVTATFKNHPKRAPVVWLVQGSVNIGGTVILDGEDQTRFEYRPSESGPGGFRGGRAKASYEIPGSGGYGPGGAYYDSAQTSEDGSGGSYATLGEGGLVGPTYGNDGVVPLLGGSGAGGVVHNGWLGWGGGAGGGAILIAAGYTITVDVAISADGGAGANYGASGSGGALRLIADTIDGTGSLSAVTNNDGYHLGGMGRIRLEAASGISLPSVNPTPSQGIPADPPQIWRPSTDPTIEATQITYLDGQGVPQTIPVSDDPGASLDYPLADVSFLTADPVTLDIAATYVPLNWEITVRVVPISGDTIAVTADPLSGTLESSTTSATFTLSGGFSAIQIRGDEP